MIDTLTRSLAEIDPEVQAAIDAELRRQQGTLEMIASENFAPVAVMQAQGSVLTNKYAEGYPGRRYYGGCEHVDVIEQLALDRLKALFGAQFANVQPHSGAQANAAAMSALLQPGDTILGLSLAHGGHLTHGMPINFSGRLYTVVPYEVNKDDMLVDMAQVERLALEHRPKLIIAGWSAYARPLDLADFRRIADLVDAWLVVSSGLRIGTPALATRGFGDVEFAEVADIIAAARLPGYDEDVRAVLAKRMSVLAERFPLYPGLDGDGTP